MEEKHKKISLCAILITAAVLKKKKEKLKKKPRQRSIWCNKWLLRRDSGRGLASMAIKELFTEDPKDFQNFARMTPRTFTELLQKVEPLILKQDTVMRAAISPSARLLITLRYLATGERFKQLSYGFRTSVSAISIIVHTTLKAIYSVLKDDFLKMPQTSNEWHAIANEFERQWNFPYCLGAIDGKHIAIRNRKGYGSYFYNYKGFHSIILLAVVDANYKFQYVNVGTNGRANDAAAFNESSFSNGLKNGEFHFPPDAELPGTHEKVPYVFVADDAFKLTSRVLKPHGQRSSDYHKIFNYRLSRARRVAENSFGIFANRFQIFQRNIDLPVEKVEVLTLAAAALHNFIRTRDGFESALLDSEDTAEISLTNGLWRNEVALTSLQRSYGNHSGIEGRTVRETYTKYFNTVGSVPWQLNAIKKFNF